MNEEPVGDEDDDREYAELANGTWRKHSNGPQDSIVADDFERV